MVINFPVIFTLFTQGLTRINAGVDLKLIIHNLEIKYKYFSYIYMRYYKSICLYLE